MHNNKDKKLSNSLTPGQSLKMLGFLASDMLFQGAFNTYRYAIACDLPAQVGTVFESTYAYTRVVAHVNCCRATGPNGDHIWLWRSFGQGNELRKVPSVNTFNLYDQV